MKIRGKAPLRISFAGGGTDLNYIFEKYGGATVSSTIDKFCHMSIETRKDKMIVVNEEELNKENEPLVYAIISYLKPTDGYNITYYNDLPPGSGLGSSSSFTVLMIRIINELNGHRADDSEVVKQAYEIETSFKEGGWQDQHATAVGQFNFMEFFKDKTLVYPLRLKYSFISELNEHFVLAYLGGSRLGKDIHKELREYSLENKKEMKRTAKIKDLAFRMRDCLLNQEVDEIGQILKENWELKRNQFTTTPRIDDIYKKALENGAVSGKICGSGQAGHFLFFVKPENRNRLLEAIKKDCKIIKFNFGTQGTETWSP